MITYIKKIWNSVLFYLLTYFFYITSLHFGICCRYFLVPWKKGLNKKQMKTLNGIRERKSFFISSTNRPHKKLPDIRTLCYIRKLIPRKSWIMKQQLGYNWYIVNRYTSFINYCILIIRLILWAKYVWIITFL